MRRARRNRRLIKPGGAKETYRLNPETGKYEWMRPQPAPSGGGGVARMFEPYASKTLPLNYTHHKGKFTDEGECWFQTEREQFDTLKRAQDAGEPLDWDY